MSWGDDGVAAETEYASVGVWVREWLAHHYARQLGADRVWCEDWRLHAEAVSRLTSLWGEWETANSAGRLGAWWRDYCDPAMDRLLDERGPFSRCRRGHRDVEPLPTADRGPDQDESGPPLDGLSVQLDTESL